MGNFLGDSLENIKASTPTFTKSDINQSITERFEDIVSFYPQNIALINEQYRWTYEELNHQVNQVAHAIIANTGSENNCVAFLVDYSSSMIITTLAILKARKIYLAINPKLPASAQQKIMQDAKPELIVTSYSLKNRAIEVTEELCPILIIDPINSEYPNYNPQIAISPDDLSTIFYTSGTTGQPKGVVKNHRTVLHRIWLAVQQDRITSTDKQSLLTHSSFASSEADTFGALLNGATLCIFDILSKGLTAFCDWLMDEQITLLHPPVLLFRRLLNILDGENLFPSVRLVALAGDNVLPSDVQKWQRHFSQSCTLTHRFSSTETGILTVVKINSDTIINNHLMLEGFPVEDKSLFLVDEEGKEVPYGMVGELVVKSAYIAEGYWCKPEETARVFQVDSCDSRQRIYRTGDFGQFQGDHSFKFIGRRDHQIKIRGYRVDLREIESVLAQFPEIAEAAVVAVQENDESKIVACFVLKPEYQLNFTDIRQRLMEILPDWKIPAYFKAMDSLPMTANGKIDRKNLSSLNLTHQFNYEYVAPRNEIEVILTDIWQKEFNLPQIGIHDNFFALGGNSLVIVRLFHEIEKRFEKQLPLNVLFESPTNIENLAIIISSLLDNNLSTSKSDFIPEISLEDYRELLTIVAGRPGIKPSPNSLMVCLSQGSKTIPVFFCANAIDEALSLQKYLEIQQTFYFLESGFSVFYGHKGIEKNIKAMAAHYVKDILKIQPVGEYVLAGFSFGANVAYEIAKQLEEQQKKVTALIIIDAQGSEAVYTYVSNLHKNFLIVREGIFRKRKLDIKAISSNHKLERYSFQGYQGQINLFLAIDRKYRSRGEKILGWLFPHRGWSKQSLKQIHSVPGDHHSMIQEPNVKVLAEELNLLLSQYQKK